MSTGEDRPRENVVGTTDLQTAAGQTGAETSSNRRWLHCCIRVTTVQVQKALWGVAMVICVCSSWAGSTQLAKLTFKKFDAPFTLTWFATTWNCLFFPLYYVGHLCKNPERQTPRQRIRWEKSQQQERVGGGGMRGVEGVSILVFHKEQRPLGFRRKWNAFYCDAVDAAVFLHLLWFISQTLR